jgi:hypothetical protein
MGHDTHTYCVRPWYSYILCRPWLVLILSQAELASQLGLLIARARSLARTSNNLSAKQSLHVVVLNKLISDEPCLSGVGLTCYVKCEYYYSFLVLNWSRIN